MLTDLGVAAAIILAAAALVVSLTKGDAAAPGAAAVTPNLIEADRSLCEAIEPLIKESSAQKNAFVALGRTGTPERDAGIAEFASQTKDWVGRSQDVLDDHSEPPRYLTRTLQRYIDDMRLYAASLRPGPAADADTAAWTDSLVALSGPFEVCGDLGVELW
ncbi:hypothetical protein [Mycobacterium sp. GA-2829]|uniref:hypothetical protein n=1 Tax=Mycobacterium sp. GA-2829 TaxID=1772283 RepID=UPI000740564F|nr:hypothetical protein [Mycobacterium sp. GA-2829]KUI36229.1 hypothetical protein AU194_16060 [Mycobacterium sp. GA-2829]